MLRRVLLFVFIIFLYANQSFAQLNSLESFINVGIKNSPLLKDYNNQLLSSSLDSIITTASYGPQVNLASQAIVAPNVGDYGYEHAITNGGNYAALVNVTKPLFKKNVKAIQYQTIDLIKQTIQNSAKISEIDLKKNITAQYLLAYSDYRNWMFNISFLKQLQEEQPIIIPLVNKGMYQQTDFLNLVLSIKSQEILCKDNFIQYKNDLAVLNFLCGNTDTTTVALQDPNVNLNRIFNISSSPVMLQFKIDSMKNGMNKAVIDMNYKPKVNAYADAGFNAIYPLNIPHNFGTSIGINVSMPLYDGKQREKQYQKIDLIENTRINYELAYSKLFQQQFMQLTEQIKLSETVIASVKGQIADQERLIELYKIEIEKGIVRFVDFLTIMNSYTASKAKLIQEEMARMQLINQMNYLR